MLRTSKIGCFETNTFTDKIRNQPLELSEKFELTVPGGAFYAFPQVPAHLGLSGTQFVERAIEQNVLIIPGSVFSERDTHIRISYACDDDRLNRGLDVLVQLAS